MLRKIQDNEDFRDRTAQARAHQRQAQLTADALCRRVRENELYRDEIHPVGDPQAVEIAELGEISDAVRDEIARHALFLEHDVNAAFAPTHAHLMEAIAASCQTSTDRVPVWCAGSPGSPAPPGRSRHNPLAVRWRRVGTGLAAGLQRLGQVALRPALAGLLLLAVGLGGHRLGSRHAAKTLPVQSLVDDFDAGLRNPAPFDLVADDPQVTAAWLGRQLGMTVRLPSPLRIGMKQLGARLHHLGRHPVAQTHYLKNGVHLALYQVYVPRYGLPEMDEVRVHGRLFFTKDCGPYRAVVWRCGESVLAMVSPLSMNDAVTLASAMRDSDIASATTL